MKPDQKSLNTPEALNRAYIAPEVVRQRKRTIEALDIKAGEIILDIGCGTGFLSYEMALVVGDQGQITTIDPDAKMVEATLDRCAGLTQVSSKVGDVTDIPCKNNIFDIVTCTQVLLYVEDLAKALNEIQRVLKPGGRTAILETDWRGVVMSSNYQDLTQTIVEAWDATVASPNLPPKLPGMLKNHGFKAIRSEAIPLLNSSFSPNSFSVNSIDWLAKNAYQQDAITKEEGQKWCNDLKQLGDKGEYFFCLNRFLFLAVK